MNIENCIIKYIPITGATWMFNTDYTAESISSDWTENILNTQLDINIYELCRFQDSTVVIVISSQTPTN